MLVYELLEKIPDRVKVGLQNFANVGNVIMLRGYDAERGCLVSDLADDTETLGTYLYQEVANISIPAEDVIVINITMLSF